MKVKLFQESINQCVGIPHYCIETSYPFVRNKHGKLIHRVKSINQYPKHLGAHYWCNGQSTSNDKNNKLEFIEAPEDHEIVCSKCEENAMKSLKYSSEYLAGKHVHIGSCVAVAECCAGVIKT